MIFVALDPGTSLARTVCATCDGAGEIDTEPFCASRYSSSCGCGGRMCGFRSVVCPDCRGSGNSCSEADDA